ncbi:MAG TPA: GTPase ObgE [Candidatus Sulfotelmatobacter sp.]|nr:GTPase ObgE [Candidatus Sulfotelmatobacter sp.]
MFVDLATITVKAGAGGRGCVSFRREAYVPRGGPDGGDGGHGGSVYIEASRSFRTLIDQKYQQLYRARSGAHGRGKDQRGADGPDCVIRVPLGTVVKDRESGEVLADLTVEGQRVLVARGGRGGRGNARFATPTHRAPRHAQPGEPGETHKLVLELKLMAEVGLIGLPNAGKSSLLARLTAAHPKVASYPFTTLTPNLGVVEAPPEDPVGGFVVADIPGLIEGAARGAGLGHQFLRHIERTRIHVQVVDVSDEAEDPGRALEVLEQEMRAYNPALLGVPRIVAANKIDLPHGRHLPPLRERCAAAGVPVFPVSAVTGEGVGALAAHLALRIAPRAGAAAPGQPDAA